MDPGTNKRRCLASLVGTKFVTDAALSAVLQKISHMEVDVQDLGTSRWSICRAVSADASIQTVHGRVLVEIDLPLVDGSIFKWTIVEPAALLFWLCEMSPGFQTALAATHKRRPSNQKQPWSITVYSDEATPGNMLAQDVTRKSYGFYLQFDEFGPELVSREEMWLIGGILHIAIVKKIEGWHQRCLQAFRPPIFQTRSGLSEKCLHHLRKFIFPRHSFVGDSPCG